ncbi:iron export ABC transporter permease subunit FetB [Magnetovibrio sp. PR-2]|uniref:ABC transporter permease n=1 Tax=Magnetovibrio sp. PR-2 TaxID=3120356 RepID=UPI002FCE12D5
MSAVYLDLSYFDLAIASLLLLLAGGLSVALNLGLEKTLGIAALRTTVQLALIGLVLKMLFEMVSPWWTGLAALVMLLLAGREVTARQTLKLRDGWSYSIATSSLIVAGGIVTILALTTAVRPDPWYDPRFALPLLGMMLGNTLTGISVGMERLAATLKREKDAIEARLALGHTRRDAVRPYAREAMRAGLMPIINAMSAAGIISLPGMMTGQILAGVDPTEAVKYQILIMFLLAGTTSIGALMAVMGTSWRLGDERDRLRLDRLRETSG